MNNYNLPMGAEFDPEAPWRQEDNPEREIEVTVSITLSKTLKITVNDYFRTGPEMDEDGVISDFIDYSECDLETAVKEQIILPQDSHKHFIVNTKEGKKAFEDAEDWIVNDLVVIKE